MREDFYQCTWRREEEGGVVEGAGGQQERNNALKRGGWADKIVLQVRDATMEVIQISYYSRHSAYCALVTFLREIKVG